MEITRLPSGYSDDMLQQPAVFVDLETTGTHPLHDRITEIAVIETRAGEVVAEWSTLLDPECSIPERIQALTGITNDMVADRPRFADIGDNLLEALDGRLLIAHNARFDYGFLRNEFRRAGIHFQTPVLCTVKLSRALYPGEHSHNLDSLIRRHALPCDARHRAMGDTRAILAFVEHLYARHPQSSIDAAIHHAIKRQTLPPGLEASDLDVLPDTPGVYLFYDERDVLLYVGKSVRLRSRIMSHFSGDHRSGTDNRISQQVRRIETIDTAGELGALLLEARLIKDRQPVHNRRLRRHRDLCAIEWEAGATAPPRIIQAAGLDPAQLTRLYGVFRTRRQAQNTLRSLAIEHALCLKRLGLEHGEGPCFAFQLKKCRGVCAGKEDELQHRLRMNQVLAALRLQAWPFSGGIGIREYSADNGRSELHVVNQWHYLGSARDAAELEALLQGSSMPQFDLDTYRLLNRFLARHPECDIIHLPDITAAHAALSLQRQHSAPVR